jgi:hypothetical protein
MTKELRSFRFVLVAAGLTVATPAFAAAVTPLCGDEKGSQDDNKCKSDNKTKDNPPKKPTNPS